MSQESVVKIQNDPRATIATIRCRDFDYHGTNQFKAEMAGVQPAMAKLMQSSGILALFSVRSNLAEAMN